MQHLLRFSPELLQDICKVLQVTAIPLASAREYSVKIKTISIAHHENQSLVFFSDQDGLVYCWSPGNPQKR